MPYDIYPAVDENYDFTQVVRQALARSLELRNTVIPMTEVNRNNLLPSELWDGRLIVNTTTDHIDRYDATTFKWETIANIADMPSIDHFDTLYVKISGDETINGIKTFSSKPVLPGNASAALEAIPKQQLDAHTHAGTYWGKWVGTQAQYDAIVTKDANVLYCITG